MFDTSRVVRLKGNLFSRSDWFRTDVTKGVTRTPDGERICSLSGDFLLGFRDAMIYECGPAYGTVLKGAGRRWGGTFMQRLDKLAKAHYEVPLRELQTGIQTTILADAFAAYGWGKLSVNWESWPGFIRVQLENPIYPDLILQAERASDQLFAGFLQAVFEYLLESQLDCLQTDCPTREATASRFLLANPAKIAELQKHYGKKLGEEGTLSEILAAET